VNDRWSSTGYGHGHAKRRRARPGLFGAVTEVLARATAALLEADVLVGQAVIDADPEIDEQIEAVKRLVWDKIDSERPTGPELRYLVSILLVLPN